jgi:hypothetical protein
VEQEYFREAFTRRNAVEDMSLHCYPDFGEASQSGETFGSDVVTSVCEEGGGFAVPPGGEGAYAEFFRAELQRPDVALPIAEAGPQPVGYAFVRMESMSLVEIRRAGAWLHDIDVDPAALALGSSSLMLSASSQNDSARQLFKRAFWGWRIDVCDAHPVLFRAGLI